MACSVLPPGSPPPVLRLKQRLPAEITGEYHLDQETTVHWHGLRLTNDQDGVHYPTQFPIGLGGRCTCRFTPRHAGTNWYRPHCKTFAQMSRGTTGIAVSEKAEHPGFDVDTPLKIRDFRLGRMARSLTFPSRATPRGVARLAPSLPQTGRLMGCPAPAGGPVRLRLGATDATRNHALSVIVAVAAQPPASVAIWRW